MVIFLCYTFIALCAMNMAYHNTGLTKAICAVAAGLAIANIVLMAVTK